MEKEPHCTMRRTIMRHISTPLIALLLLTLIPSTASATEVDIFGKEVDGFRRLLWVSGGFGGGTSSLSGPGLKLSSQLMLQVNTHIAVGMEYGAFIRFGGSIGESAVAVEQFVQVPKHARLEFRLGKKSVRPYVGLGFGKQAIAGQFAEVYNDPEGGSSVAVSQIAGSFWGGSAHLGLDIGRFRIALNYHMTGGADFVASQNVSVNTTNDMTSAGAEQRVEENKPARAHLFSLEIGPTVNIVTIRPSEDSFFQKLEL